jgi:hypothetical protein
MLVDATLAQSKLNSIIEEVIIRLTQYPHAIVKIRVQISADLQNGVSDSFKRNIFVGCKPVPTKVKFTYLNALSEVRRSFRQLQCFTFATVLLVNFTRLPKRQESSC